ncbi:MAG: hypothetical protein MHMPM18_003935 [Marteilia pararefringens]
MRDKIRLHYNSMAMNDSRLQSNIYCLRLLHNWIKSCLIQQCVEFLNLMTKRAPFAVLDLCCGKGGDLLKWSQYPNLEYLAGIGIYKSPFLRLNWPALEFPAIYHDILSSDFL